MALVTANDSPVLDTSLVTPRVGAWHADLLVDDLTPLPARVTIRTGEGGPVFVGTATRSDEDVDVARARVVAGAGGLGLSARPTRYQNATVGTILRQLCATAGEVVDPTADAATLAIQVSDWTVGAVPTGAAIGALLAAWAPGRAWRMLPAGTLWVGVETWPEFVAGDDVQVIEDEPETNTAVLHLDQPIYIPGRTAFLDPANGGLGRRVSYVHTRVAPRGPVEAEVWFEPPVPEDVDRMTAALAAIVRAIPPGIDPRTVYWAAVVQQSGGTIHVVPEDRGLPDMGGVKLAMPPGDSVEGVTGGRALVGFAGRDRTAYVHGFDGATPRTRVIRALQTVDVGDAGGQPPPLGDALLTYLTKVATAINAIAPGSIEPPTALALLAKKVRVT